jgi:hypothetical protein
MQNVKTFLPKALMTVILISITGCAKKTPDFLVAEQAQLSKVDLAGRSEIVLEGSGPVRIMQGELLVLRERQIITYYISGKEIQRIPIPEDVLYIIDFVVIPDGRLAFLDNQNDAIYFVSNRGKHLKTVTFLDKSDKRWQNMDGIVVDNKLIVSENGNSQLIAVNLSNYQVSIFRDFTGSRGPLGTITYADKNYYICQRNAIYTFSENSENVDKVASIPEGNITGIAVVNGRMFVVVNGMSRITEKSLAAKRLTTEGILYEIDCETGESTILREGLNYPNGLHIIR